jgi:hypothetical protein
MIGKIALQRPAAEHARQLKAGKVDLEDQPTVKPEIRPKLPASSAIGGLSFLARPSSA